MAGLVNTCVVVAMLLVAALAKPADDEKKSRVLNNQELSDELHFNSIDEHNPDYDHEAFLGEDEADVYDALPPEESKRRLGVLVGRIDSDGDGFVSVTELQQWIEYTQKRYLDDDVKRQWETHNPKNTDTLTWDNYKTLVYGFMNDLDATEAAEQDDEETATYQQMLTRDARRWKLADVDADGALTYAEFSGFLHPEETTHMKHIVVTETLEDIDKDGDGKISMEEYIGDMYKGEEDDTEPAWVNNERDQFKQFRDKDGDGAMDEQEVREWIVPPEYNHANAEAQHLVKEADVDGDGQLTTNEILDKYDVFVGSQATDFGEALNRHDEF